jgi:GGDEF domain-containing protein
MDILSKHGENGFVILLPETEMVKAETLVERLVSAIKNNALWWNSRRLEIEITCGISATSELKNHETEKELISKTIDRLQKITCSNNVSYNAVK